MNVPCWKGTKTLNEPCCLGTKRAPIAPPAASNACALFVRDLASSEPGVLVSTAYNRRLATAPVREALHRSPVTGPKRTERPAKRAPSMLCQSLSSDKSILSESSPPPLSLKPTLASLSDGLVGRAS